MSEKSVIIVIAFQATTMQMVIVDNFLNILMTKATNAFLSTTENPIKSTFNWKFFISKWVEFNSFWRLFILLLASWCIYNVNGINEQHPKLKNNVRQGIFKFGFINFQLTLNYHLLDELTLCC